MNLVEFRGRLVARAARAQLVLKTHDVDLLATYFELLSRWNRRINLTALPLEPLHDESLDRLVVEPLAAARYVPDSPLTWFDFGSGGGSPAIPLKVVRPLARLTLVENRAKKAAFLRELERELHLADITVLNTRFEVLTPTPDSTPVAELVTVRAVRIDRELLMAARRLLVPRGRLFVFGAEGVDPGVDPGETPLFADARSYDLLPGSHSRLTILSSSG